MVKVKIIKKGLLYPIGKIINVSKTESKEAIKIGHAELIEETNIKGVGLVEVEKKGNTRKEEAEYSFSKRLLDELMTSDYSFDNWMIHKDKFLEGKVSFKVFDITVISHQFYL